MQEHPVAVAGGSSGDSESFRSSESWEDSGISGTSDGSRGLETGEPESESKDSWHEDSWRNRRGRWSDSESDEWSTSSEEEEEEEEEEDEDEVWNDSDDADEEDEWSDTDWEGDEEEEEEEKEREEGEEEADQVA